MTTRAWHIDVYLSTMINDLKLLWDDRVEVFDSFANESFQMHAMLFCIINDFLTCGNLLSYSVKGHRSCRVYEENILYEQLKH